MRQIYVKKSHWIFNYKQNQSNDFCRTRFAIAWKTENVIQRRFPTINLTDDALSLQTEICVMFDRTNVNNTIDVFRLRVECGEEQLSLECVHKRTKARNVCQLFLSITLNASIFN